MGLLLSVLSYVLPGPEETAEKNSVGTQTEQEVTTFTSEHQSDVDVHSENSWSGSENLIIDCPRDEWAARSLIPNRREAAERCRRRQRRQRLAVMRGRLEYFNPLL